MSFKYLSCGLLIFVSSFVLVRGQGFGKADGWNPIDWTTLPPAQPDDTIEIYYLVAPLLEDQLGNFFAGLHLYHGGLAFINTNSNYTFTLNYDALHFFKAAFFPKIVTYDNGTRDLIWQNQGASFIYFGINETYWTTSQTFVSSIDGNLYNQFMNEFISQSNNSFPYYDALGVEAMDETVYIPSFDCFDFVWKTMDWLFAHGAHTQLSTLERDHSYFYSSEPPLNETYAYYNDEKVRDDIISMYELFQLHVNDMNLIELLGTIVVLFEQRFYLRVGTDYWKNFLSSTLRGQL